MDSAAAAWVTRRHFPPLQSLSRRVAAPHFNSHIYQTQSDPPPRPPRWRRAERPVKCAANLHADNDWMAAPSPPTNHLAGAMPCDPPSPPPPAVRLSARLLQLIFPEG